MRRILLALLTVLLALPALAVPVDFESLPGAIPYLPGAAVPTSARLSSLQVAGVGEVRFKTRSGAAYVALVTHMSGIGIVAVSKKGKISPQSYLEVSLKKAAKGSRLDSILVQNAGERHGDDPSTPTVTETDFVLGYDNPGAAFYYLRTAKGAQLPVGGGGITRLTPMPLDFTQIPEPIIGFQIRGDAGFTGAPPYPNAFAVVIGDLMITPPAAPLRATPTPEPALPALLGAAGAGLAWRVRRRRSR